MSFQKDLWLQSMYTSGRDHGHDVVFDQPDIDFVALESEIFNYLIGVENYRKYNLAVENNSRKAALRVWRVKHGTEH